MTASELQSIARRLGNQSHCRYWLNFFNRPNDVMMAIQCVDAALCGFAPVRLKCLEEKNFELYSDGSAQTQWIYLIPRTNADGSPFESKLF